MSSISLDLQSNSESERFLGPMSFSFFGELCFTMEEAALSRCNTYEASLDELPDKYVKDAGLEAAPAAAPASESPTAPTDAIPKCEAASARQCSHDPM